jgi:tRNA threonylcarbamoyladenosine biosynthesis protein TsaB
MVMSRTTQISHSPLNTGSSLLLAVDTSTSQAGLALYNGRVQAEMLWSAGRNHARQLMPAIAETLGRLGLRPSDLGAIAAARGPGSFTGLRVGLAVARGLQFALGIPLYGVGSLDVVAAGLAASPWLIRAVLDAGRGRFATASYRLEGEEWVQVEPIAGVDLDGLVKLASEPCTVVGDLTDEARERLATPGARVASPAASVRRPSVLAEIAWRAWMRGDPPDPDAGEPIYLARG